ncbi:MAG: MFS transporter [Pseudomonadota bacterium]
MNNRRLIGPVLVHGAYLIEISAFVLILNFLDFVDHEKEWLFAIYSAALCVALPLGGLISDWRGPRFAYLVGGTIFIAACLLLVIAETLFALLVIRAAQGFGAGICAPVVPILLTPDRSEAGRYLANWGSVSSALSAIAPILIAGLGHFYSWQVAWLFVPAMALIGLCLGSSRPPKPKRTANTLRWGQQFWAVIVAIAFTFGCSTLVVFTLPFALTNGLASGGALCLLWLTAAVFSAALSRHLTQENAWRFILIGVALNLIALLFLTLSMPYVSAVLCGMGIGMTNAPTTYLVLHHARPGLKGLGSSMDIVSARLGGGLAVVLFGHAFM